jgi:hypothetical protein
MSSLNFTRLYFLFMMMVGVFRVNIPKVDYLDLSYGEIKKVIYF